MAGGMAVTLEGEFVTPDHKSIITPQGEIIPNFPAAVGSMDDC